MPEPAALDWDPEVDAPATILVLGDDIVAIEAALYARFLGYAVLLVCNGRVGDSLQDGPGLYVWEQATSPLGLAALQAQDVEFPSKSDSLSAAEFIQKYLIPLARTDLLYDSVQINSRLVSVSRVGCSPRSALTNEQRASLDFRVLVDSRKRGEYSQLVDVILDCSGFIRRTGLASGGGIAIGEREFLALGSQDREPTTPGHVVLYGKSAGLLEKAVKALEAANRVTWIQPQRYGVAPASEEFEHQLAELQQTAQEKLAVIDAWGIERIAKQEAGWSLQVQNQDEETIDLLCDGFIPADTRECDWSFVEQVPLASQVDCKETGRTAEPHYYVLGPKSQSASTDGVASMAGFRLQIQACFAQIGGRKELNLYETVRPQE